jgi:hypothetical protein
VDCGCDVDDFFGHDKLLRLFFFFVEGLFAVLFYCLIGSVWCGVA